MLDAFATGVEALIVDAWTGGIMDVEVVTVSATSPQNARQVLLIHR